MYTITPRLHILTATLALLMLNLCAGTSSAQIITTIAGTGSGAFSGDGGQATLAALHFPRGITVDATGNIYFTDMGNFRVRKIATSGTIATIAGNGTIGASGDGVATASALYYAFGVGTDGSGNVYFVERDLNRVRKVSPSGAITTYACVTSAGYSGDNGPATDAQMQYPDGLAVDGSGNVYIADEMNNVVRKVSTSGIITTIAGTGVSGYGGDGGQATAAQLRGPKGVAVDGVGNIFIADAGDARIRKINTSGVISTVAGNGTAGYSGDGGSAIAANLNFPVAVAVDGSGNLYIADYLNVVRKVTPSGMISTLAGNGTAGFSGDGGLATAALLDQPTGIAADFAGNVYIADQTNNRIRKISCVLPPAGTITGNTSVCVSSSTTLSATVSGGVWSSSNPAVVSVNSSGVATVLTPGSANIVYTVTNACGSNTVTVPIAIVTSPPVAGAITGPVTVCAGAAISLANTTPGGSWSSSSTTVLTVNASGIATGVASGSATISYLVTNSCGSDIATTVINVTGLPPTAGTITGATALNTGGTTTLSNTTGGGLWSSGTTAIATVNASGVVYGVAAGTASISYTVTNSCGGISAVVPVTVTDLPTLVNSIPGSSTGVHIAPNPASGTATLIINGGSNYNEVTVSNISGTILRTLNFTGNKTDIDITALPPGMYLFRVRTDNKVFTERIIIR